MLTLEQIKKMTTLPTKAIARILVDSGYLSCSFKSSNFLFLNEDLDFCYDVTFYDEHTQCETHSRVFVRIDKKTGKVIGSF